MSICKREYKSIGFKISLLNPCTRIIKNLYKYQHKDKHYLWFLIVLYRHVNVFKLDVTRRISRRINVIVVLSQWFRRLKCI